jgi:hypothetical protein
MVIKTKKPFKKFMVKYNIKKSWVVVGVIVAIFILAILFGKPKPADADEGYSTLPGWSGGYRYYFNMDESPQSRLILFGKYKQRSGDTIKFGWDRQTGKDLNQFSFNHDDGGILFLEQEFKF